MEAQAPIAASNKGPESPYMVGDKVHSLSIGNRAAFDGVVTKVFLNGYRLLCFHVRDEEGIEWHRDLEDLTPL